MKNFTKNLPVEGEIKGGMKAMYFGTDHLFKPIAKIVDVVDDVHGSTLEDSLWKPVRLFLCSRDIQVGDKITLDGIEFVTYEEGEIDSSWQNHVDNGFKVIGEVSPEAVWVTEGMEFDDTQIQDCYESWDSILWVPIKKEWYDSYTRKKRHIVKLKCSQCNTFH